MVKVGANHRKRIMEFPEWRGRSLFQSEANRRKNFQPDVRVKGDLRLVNERLEKENSSLRTENEEMRRSLNEANNLIQRYENLIVQLSRKTGVKLTSSVSTARQ
uniref:BZIP domain-containing protein n=1 Tax=Hanusia phi TaxID=3032 RepID=A0A7S0HP65_9CRYP